MDQPSSGGGFTDPLSIPRFNSLSLQTPPGGEAAVELFQFYFIPPAVVCKWKKLLFYFKFYTIYPWKEELVGFRESDTISPVPGGAFAIDLYARKGLQ